MEGRRMIKREEGRETTGEEQAGGWGGGIRVGSVWGGGAVKEDPEDKEDEARCRQRWCRGCCEGIAKRSTMRRNMTELRR
ncbi:hypothetical protein E2C01_071207 [Portunus trituberculatus]|uniref:Uncharacterized protein n=1 Tax=Portunus trituberculatus TaxID=210409 RepID=A0A5B7I3T0_PORTR|nr:hypothetical protein [Portunus trituberculatus]